MLSGTHFYHATIKRIVSVFGTLFNNITIGRHSGNKISNIQRVPISYGPRQKFISRMNKDLDGTKIAIKLPRMSFEITTIDYDTSTKLNRLNTTLTAGSNNSPRTRNKMYQSVPYTIGMQLNILARNQEDALQIVEQIIPTFSPEYTVTIKDIEGPGSRTDVPFILNSVTFSDDYEGEFQGRRTLTYTLDFTIRARFAPNTSVASIIKKVETEIADFTNVSVADARPMSTINVSQDSPSAPIDTFVSLIDPVDVHTVDLVYKDVSLSGINPLNRLVAISIASGATADFDRVEDEDFGTSISNITGASSGSGSDGQFSVSINGLTGETTSITLLNQGSGYIATETITISAAPYNNTNLVLTVDSIFDGTGDEPAGAINTFSITSGSAANSDVAATYNPVFTRSQLPTEPVLNSPNDSPGLHGSEGLVSITLDKTGLITGATIDNGGYDYNTSQQIKLGPQRLGETASTFLLENLIVTGGGGSGAQFFITLNGIDGTLANLGIDAPGTAYQIGEDLTIAGNLLGENSPGESAPATDLVINVDNVDEVGGVTAASIISGATSDFDRVDAKKFKYDSPFTELIMDITTTDSVAISGTYQKSGSLNNKPKYIHSTSSNVEISYAGTQWELKQSNEVLAINTNNSPAYNIPFTNWNVLGRDAESMVFSTTENTEFTIGEKIEGNITTGEAIILSSNNSNITVNTLEQAYVEDEIIVGADSGNTRTVFKTTLG